MSFIEFVGFIISFAAMIFLVLRRFFEERQRRLNPEEFARQEKMREENLRRLMKSRGIYSVSEEEEKEEFLPVVSKNYNQPVSPKMSQEQAFIKLRESQKQQTVLKNSPVVQQGNYGAETARDKKRNLAASDSARYQHHDLKPADSYEVIRIEKVTAANRLLSSLKSPQDMLVIKEIFDKPLSMRTPQD